MKLLKKGIFLKANGPGKNGKEDEDNKNTLSHGA